MNISIIKITYAHYIYFSIKTFEVKWDEQLSTILYHIFEKYIILYCRYFLTVVKNTNLPSHLRGVLNDDKLVENGVDNY